MQILSPEFVAAPRHHQRASFLPAAFSGARLHAAYHRGVKLIAPQPLRHGILDDGPSSSKASYGFASRPTEDLIQKAATWSAWSSPPPCAGA